MANAMSDCATTLALLPITGLLDADDVLVAAVISNHGAENEVSSARVW